MSSFRFFSTLGVVMPPPAARLPELLVVWDSTTVS